MPNRILREGILSSKRVNSLSIGAEVFYRRLMSKVDDYGRFTADPELLRAALFPLQLDRVSPAYVRECLTECSQPPANARKCPLISCYEGADGEKYLVLNDFGQRTRTPSRFPEPAGNDSCAQMPADVSNIPPIARASNTTTTTHTNTQERESEGKPNGQGDPKACLQAAQSEYPLTMAEIRKHSPAVDENFVRGLATKTCQYCLSMKDFPQDQLKDINDLNIASAVKESYDTWTSKRNKHGTGLLLDRVPKIMHTIALR